jgi:DNA-binding NarL/FixJ family response regulator
LLPDGTYPYVSGIGRDVTERVLAARKLKKLQQQMNQAQKMEAIGVLAGGDTYDQLKILNPEVKALLSSGYSLNGQSRDILERGCRGFIQKPFKLQQLSQKIREILS